MKHEYRIINEINGSECVCVEAAHERSALNKYKKGLMSTGFYDIVNESDGRPRLISSFGSCFRADRCISGSLGAANISR